MSLRAVGIKVFVDQTLRKKAAKFGIRIGQAANVGNHLHLKVKISSRKGFQNFLRSTTAVIARKVTGARRGKPFGKFWDGLAFTRVLKSSLEELNLRGYIDANFIQAEKGYVARVEYLTGFRAWVYGECAGNTYLETKWSSA